MVASSGNQTSSAVHDTPDVLPKSNGNTAAPRPPCSLLRTSGTDIVDATGQKVVLKGVGIGGFLNMENFITGYPGHEYQHRNALAGVLGHEKAAHFFDRMIYHFFSDADAALLASLGLNCVRIPFNYRHFMDDANPGVIKAGGFALLDRCVEICARHNIYVILDLHSVPGGQNQDWHCDSGISRALFWEFRDFQDRTVQLWEAIASHYVGNPVVAGYNPLNEPADPEHTRLVAWYERAERAIRAVDPDHILFLDGNTYAMDFSAFPRRPLPNAVYACHDYSMMGFPGAEQYTGSREMRAKLRASFERKVRFMREQRVPIWNGEFGPVYADPRVEGDEQAAATNEKRFALLEEQLTIYRESDVSWSIWLYKDIGYQGMVYLDPDGAYMRLIRSFVRKKQRLGLDFWGTVDKGAVQGIYDPFIKSLKEMVPERFHNAKYPKIWTFDRQVERVVRECLLSDYLGLEMAELFRGKTEEELDELARSFAVENCRTRTRLNEILRADAAKVP